MLIRVFTFTEIPLEKYLNFLRLENGARTTWKVEMCDPMTWIPTPGDIHIYVDFPVRLAVPWAKFNVFAVDTVLDVWAWTKNEMDLTIPAAAIRDRTRAIPTLRRVLHSAIKGQHSAMLPLPPSDAELPKVGIITVTRNRPEWWVNMLQNVVKQDWPVTNMEWIIVDDGDAGQRLGTVVDEFMEKSPGIMIRYVESLKTMTIGAKRNAAVEAASEDVSVFVCMDDDDHYPRDSIKNRLAWLNRALPVRKGKEGKGVKDPVQSQIGYCSMLPMYDLTRYISAMNVPDMEIGPAERVSEATLVFTRAAWVARPFPDTNMAEGIEFVEGREELSVEMPSKDVIVSFIHTKNSSSRRIPKEEEPNGCHYGFTDEFFKYLHQIGGGQTV